MEQLVNDGTITSSQASAIGQALQTAMQSGETPDSGSDPLAGLVSAGTITQGQADSVKSVLDPSQSGQQKDFMSSVLDSLVTDGTLTQDQEDAVKQTMMQGAHGKPSGPPPASASSGTGSSSSTSSTSDSTNLSGLTADEILQLLSSGKITAKQAETAIKALEAKAVSSATSSASTSSTSDSNGSSPLDSLVTNGTITQKQEDSIRSAFKQAMDTNKAMQAYSLGSSANNTI